MILVKNAWQRGIHLLQAVFWRSWSREIQVGNAQIVVNLKISHQEIFHEIPALSTPLV